MPKLGQTVVNSPAIATIMPIFIICSLLLTTLIETQSAYLNLLNIEAVWISTACLAALFLCSGCLKLAPGGVWHDGFASAALWTWYGYWQPLFSEGSPQFSLFPVYFALLSSWMLFGVINRSARFDWESQQTLRYFQRYLTRFDPCLMAALVLLTLAFPEHYLSFPLAMTFFIVRSAFFRCLEIIDSL
jgi:hypothetical protein